MWVPVPSICDRKLPVHLWVLQGWLVRQLDRWRESQSDSYLPLGCLVPPGVWWSWHVACGVSQPGRLPGSQHPWWLWSKWLWLPKWCRWPWPPWQLQSRGPQHPGWHGCRQLWLLWWTLLSQNHSNEVPCPVPRLLSTYRHQWMTYWPAAPLGLCWPSLKVGPHLWEGDIPGVTAMGEMVVLPLERLLPSQCHLGHSPGMRFHWPGEIS